MRENDDNNNDEDYKKYRIYTITNYPRFIIRWVKS